MLNSLFSWIVKKRIHQIDLFKKYPIEVQQEVFLTLIKKAANTEWGKKHHYKAIDTIGQYKQIVPLQDYDSLKKDILRLKHGETNILWPEEIKWFSKSSGTASDKSKFIPVSKDSIENCHYKGGKDLMAMYYTNVPSADLYSGKMLAMGGSSQINQFSSDSYYGDLSAIIIKNFPYWADWKQTPGSQIALMEDWEAKIEKIAHITSTENVTNISGVPSWTSILLKRILEITGKETIMDVWPNLQLYIHGGVSFTPYQHLFDKLIGKSKTHYIEIFNASEGFFGIQDQLNNSEMLLMLDYGVFYEFIPEKCVNDEQPKTLTLEEVEVGKNYAMVISTNAGLWRYQLGDVITFTNTTPFRIKIIGRTKHSLNAFGEELSIENAERAIEIACKKTNATISDFTAAPIFMSNTNNGGHEWLIEFDQTPKNIDFFTIVFDNALKSLNSDYEAKRYKDIAIKLPIIRNLPKGIFYQWLKSKNKLGGQHKVPRLSNSRKYIEEIKQLKLL